MTQSRHMSLIEAATNVIVGNALAVGMQIGVFPVFGIHIALGDQLAIAFTGVSLLGCQALRRLGLLDRKRKKDQPKLVLS